MRNIKWNLDHNLIFKYEYFPKIHSQIMFLAHNKPHTFHVSYNLNNSLRLISVLGVERNHVIVTH
jgi:hypothetical protein